MLSFHKVLTLHSRTFVYTPLGEKDTNFSQTTNLFSNVVSCHMWGVNT